MAQKPSSDRRLRFVLAADGAASSAAIFALLTTVVLLAAQAVGDQEVPVGIQIAGALVMWLGGVAGPVIAWLLHDRRITMPAVLGALLGAPVTAAVFFLFVALATALGWAISPISDAEGTGPLVAGALLALGFVMLLIWLVVDGVRDLRAAPPENRKLDIARILAFVVIATYAAIVVVSALGEAGPEMLEAIAFMMMGAVSGAAVVTMADLAAKILKPRAGEAATEPAVES